MEWPDIARKQAGVISRAQLREMGVAEHRVTDLVRTGSLIAQEHGVFLVRGAPMTYLARLWTVTLSVGGVLGFATAAHLHGFDEQPVHIHVIRFDRDHVRRPRGVRLYRIPVPDAEISEIDGLLITSRRWTLLDHLGRLPRPEAMRLADRSLQRGWITLGDLDWRVRTYRGRTGNAQLRLILEQAHDGAAAESERRLHAILDRAALTGWIPNYAVVVDGRTIAVVDVAFVDQKVALEIDGWAFHSDVDRFQRDRQRQNALVALGWIVLRFTWADLTERPSYVRTTITSRIRAGNVL